MIVFDGIIFSLQRNGGISVYFSELLSRFSRLEYESKLLMFGDNEVSLRMDQLPNRINVHSRQLERYRNVVANEAKLFHSSYFRTAEYGDSLNISTVYDFTYERFMRGPKKWGHSWQKFRALRKSDAILCISESTKLDLQKYLPEITEDRIFVTPLAANASFFSNIPTKCSEDYVVFVGARGGYKNFDLLVRALQNLSDVRLFVVGGGTFSAGEISILEKFIPGRYFHQGNVTVERLKEIYSLAICLVYPSLYEGFGIPVLEAMLAGCPVIALRSSSIPEVAGNAALLLESPDVGLLSDSILRIAQSDTRLEFISGGRERAKLFSWDSTFSKTRSVYETLIGHSLN